MHTNLEVQPESKHGTGIVNRGRDRALPQPRIHAIFTIHALDLRAVFEIPVWIHASSTGTHTDLQYKSRWHLYPGSPHTCRSIRGGFSQPSK
jgi:hypothetical protein